MSCLLRNEPRFHGRAAHIAAATESSVRCAVTNPERRVRLEKLTVTQFVTRSHS
jgi:hypothetical protein